MPDGVCEVRAPAGFEVREQIELAGVIRAVAPSATDRHDAKRIAAAAE